MVFCKGLLRAALALAGTVLVGMTAFGSSMYKTQDHYKIADPHAVYDLIPREREPGYDMGGLINASDGSGEAKGGPWEFNWIARRDPCFLVSGDLPRFALARTFRVPELNPPIAKLGDLRIRMSIGDKSVWLDEARTIEARFHPWGTVHRVDLAPELPAKVTLTACLLKNHGIGVKIEIESNREIGLELVYGGMAYKDLIISVPYFYADEKDASDDTATKSDGSWTISDPKVPAKVIVEADNPAKQEIAENRIRLSYNIPSDGKRHVVRFMASQKVEEADKAIAVNDLETEIAAAQSYYKSLLAPYSVSTPDESVNAAFYSGIVNLDYIYQSPAWLEGIHKWNSYFNNNYQISAAILLGQFDRAQGALRFFAEPDGPAPTRNADGSPNLGMPQHQFEEGIHYFVLQLYRYWKATGDMALIDRVWEPTVKSFERMRKVRDPEGNLLTNWHQGCNMFLYQADHLSLPGDAFSPSIMTSHCLDLLAEMALSRGENERAAKWSREAAYIESETIRRLWSEEDGKFIGTIDPQGLAMQANYYTDFVYPELYSSLPDSYSWRSLDACKDTLWVDGRLMRIGNLKPKLFGNDNVMPVQMCEASEAYFKAGRADEGLTLLSSVALAATVRTDSPGSFPERMNDDGWGWLDYAFGNPAGSYVRTVAGGLFGLEAASPGGTINWYPSIPDNWKSAELKLKGTSVRISGVHGDRTYSITHPSDQALLLRVPMHHHKVVSVTDRGGADLPYEKAEHPSGDFIIVKLPAAKEHSVRVVSKSPVKKAVVSKGKLEKKTTEKLRFSSSDRREPLNLTSIFNSDWVYSRNLWRYGPVGVDFAKNIDSNERLSIGDYTFKVKKEGNRVAVVEIGDLDAYNLQLVRSHFPTEIRVDVNKPVKGFELLMVSEFKTRCTWMKVGEITLYYKGGNKETVPLVYGRNVECMSKPFATDVVTRDLGGMCNAYAFTVKADPRRILESFEIKVMAADGSLGLAGANAVEQGKLAVSSIEKECTHTADCLPLTAH